MVQGAKAAPEAPKDMEDPKNNDDTEKKESDPLGTVGEVFSFAQTTRVKVCIGVGFCFAVISGAIFPVMAYLFAAVNEELVADVGNDNFMENIRNMAFYFMGLGVLAFTTMTMQAMLLETAATDMSNLLKIQWFEALLRQDMAYYDIRDVSGTATIISINGAKFKKGTGKKLADAIQFSITFVGGLIYGFWASWRTSLVVLTIVPFMILSTSFLLKMNTSQTARANSSYAEAGSIVYMTVSSIRTILALNAVESVIEKFTAATQKAYDAAVSQVMLFGLANGSVMASFLLAYVPVTLYGSFLLYDNVRDSGCDPSGAVPGNDRCDPSGIGVFGALFGITFAGAVLPQVSSSIEAFTGARSAVFPALVAINRRTTGDDDQSDPDLEEKSHAIQRRGSTQPLPKYVIDSSSPNGLKPEQVEGNIEFKDVHFAYPTRQEVEVYNGFSLKVEAGKTVALCGPSGGGKSTCVQLLERFYDPSSGSITLDGNDLKSLNVRWLREHIGLVSQEPKLFALSIRDNIAIGFPGATNEQIEEAAKKANAHDFIMSFPQGYDTQVGDQGSQLSGGQKQRIAIARVLIKKPKIILLDEATSALDSESEVVVQEALDVLMKEGKQTVIVIAHRLSTIKNADVIAVVKEGKVVETGNHTELISKEGHYFDLVEAQKGNKKGDSSGPPSRSSSFSGEQSGGDDVEEVASEHLKAGEKTPVIKFDDVHFNYPSRTDNKVFRGLNLSIYEGETVAIVGPSGQGKSTVIQLIENFYRPSSGTVKFHGVDMKELNTRWLRDQLSLVSQEPVLFDSSILENIRFGFEATQDEIEAAAKKANAHDFIMSFPDGYDTQVGAGSTQISGGQKQRIAIARALLRKPKVLLLDEATSALDSASEKIVQDALDKIMADKTQTTIVIAHRLSTIRDADRIAVIDHGRVREVGTHDELMAKENGRYRLLQELQSLDGNSVDRRSAAKDKEEEEDTPASPKHTVEKPSKEEEKEEKMLLKANSSKARMLGKGDRRYFVIGSIGAIFAGLMFPGWGFIFAYMIELLYYPVLYCDGVEFLAPEPFLEDCDAYWNDAADSMAELSLHIFYGTIGILCTTLLGDVLLYYGFGTATERMNKRVRDALFKNLVRQEISWFDVRPVGSITTQLSDDAALIHSFVGEPIRTLVLNLASVAVGLVVSFYYMWPFALLTLGILPFMAFGAEAEMAMYMGEDEADLDAYEEHSSGGIVVESLLNIRTVASLAIESERMREFKEALVLENPHPFRSNFIKGSTSGLGQFVQMWGIALMFWWGGWLLFTYPNQYDFRSYLISMFSLLFSLSGMGFAMQGATDREKAKAAAERVFELIDRKSEIDPLSDEGKKLN